MIFHFLDMDALRACLRQAGVLEKDGRRLSALSDGYRPRLSLRRVQAGVDEEIRAFVQDVAQEAMQRDWLEAKDESAEEIARRGGVRRRDIEEHHKANVRRSRAYRAKLRVIRERYDLRNPEEARKHWEEVDRYVARLNAMTEAEREAELTPAPSKPKKERGTPEDWLVWGLAGVLAYETGHGLGLGERQVGFDDLWAGVDPPAWAWGFQRRLHLTTSVGGWSRRSRTSPGMIKQPGGPNVLFVHAVLSAVVEKIDASGGLDELLGAPLAAAVRARLAPLTSREAIRVRLRWPRQPSKKRYCPTLRGVHF